MSLLHKGLSYNIRGASIEVKKNYVIYTNERKKHIKLQANTQPKNL